MRRIGLLLFLAACGQKADVIDWQRMEEQAKAVPYRDTPYFADGRVNQRPPEGSVAQEQAIGEPIAIAVTPALVARGRERFEIFCAPCHGLAGDGDSMVAQSMTLRRPPSLLATTIRAYAPERIFRVVTIGWGLMPSYRTQLTITDRWAVVAYVRALQVAGGSVLADLPDDMRAEANRALGGSR